GRDDRLADFRIELAQRHVHLGRRALDDAQRPHHRLRLLLPADPEVLQRALGLRAPVAVGRDLDRAKGVGFGSRRGHLAPRRAKSALGLAPCAGRARRQTVNPAAVKGSVRTRSPVASNTALASAGATPGTPGSPAPPTSASGLSNSRTSTFGAWFMRITR